MNAKPLVIPVDFGNCDPDGAVRLVTRGTVEAIKDAGVTMQEGVETILTDGELRAFGKVTMRDGMWVALVSSWLA
jgi:hypothetical protein